MEKESKNGSNENSPSCPESEQECAKKKKDFKVGFHDNGPASAIYFFGVIGAAVYYISTAATFWMGAFGILKALVWPALLVYELMKHLSI